MHVCSLLLPDLQSVFSCRTTLIIISISDAPFSASDISSSIFLISCWRRALSSICVATHCLFLVVDGPSSADLQASVSALKWCYSGSLPLGRYTFHMLPSLVLNAETNGFLEGLVLLVDFVKRTMLVVLELILRVKGATECEVCMRRLPTYIGRDAQQMSSTKTWHYQRGHWNSSFLRLWKTSNKR